MKNKLLAITLLYGLAGISYATVSDQKHFTFNDNAAPAGITVEAGTPTYSGGQLHLDGNTWISSPSGISGTDNYGYEVVATATSFDAAFDFVATMTSAGTANSGVGLFHASGNWSAILQGIASFGSSPSGVGVEVYLSFVRDGGTNKIFVNGIHVASNISAVRGGGDVSTLNIGANRSDANSPSGNKGIFHGTINEVRTFTFTAGAFTTTDLLFQPPTAVYKSVVEYGGAVTDNGAIDTSATPAANFGLDKVSEGVVGDMSLYLTKEIDSLGLASPPKLILDLGADQTLKSLAIWAYLSTVNQDAIKDFGIKFATSAEGSDAVGSSITYNPIFTAVQHTNATQQIFNFSETVTARYVELTLLSNHGGTRYAFSEIQFSDELGITGSPSFPAISPAPQTDAWWPARHAAKQIEVQAKQNNVGMLFIGDSITHFWSEKDDLPGASVDGGLSVWNQYYVDENRKPVNLGYGADMTNNVLWRLQHGEMDGLFPKVTVLKIGTNNAGIRNDPVSETVVGIAAVIREIQLRAPDTNILLLGILPREFSSTHALRVNNDAVNAIISGYADNESVYYLSVNSIFLNANGTLKTEFFHDQLHPRLNGYTIWAAEMEPTVKKLFGEIDSGVDADADTIDDGWEILHFGNMTTASATSNQDGDTHSDLDEFRFLTDPTDASDFATLKLDNSQLKFDTVTGVSYRLQSSPDLDDWTDQGSVIVGDGTEQTLLSIPSSPSSLFYRIRIN